MDFYQDSEVWAGRESTLSLSQAQFHDCLHFFFQEKYVDRPVVPIMTRKSPEEARAGGPREIGQRAGCCPFVLPPSHPASPPAALLEASTGPAKPLQGPSP